MDANALIYPGLNGTSFRGLSIPGGHPDQAVAVILPNIANRRKNRGEKKKKIDFLSVLHFIPSVSGVVSGRRRFYIVYIYFNQCLDTMCK